MIKLFITLIFSLVLLSNPIRIYAQEYDWDSLYGAVTSDKQAIETFYINISDENIDQQTLLIEVNSLVTQLDTSINNYYIHDRPSVSDNFDLSLSRMLEGIVEYRNALNKYRQGIEIDDKYQIENAVTDMESAENKINAASEDFTIAVEEIENEENSTGWMYSFGTLIFFCVTLFLFFKSRGSSKYTAVQAKKELYWNLFLSSLVPFIGFLVTLFTYEVSSSGSYTIASGAIVLGTINLIRGLYNFYNLRPQIQQLIKVEGILVDHYSEVIGLFLYLSEKEFIAVIKSKFDIDEGSAKQVVDRLDEVVQEFKKQQRKSQDSPKKENTNAYNPYEILGLSKSATLDDVKSQFRKLAKQFHPDVSKDDGTKFKEIMSAYTYILNERGKL